MKTIGLRARWILASALAIALLIGVGPGGAIAVSGATTRVSVASSGAQGAADLFNLGSSRRPSISSDGRYVAFESASANLVTGDTNGEADAGEDIFVHDRVTGGTTRVSVSSSGAQGNGTGSSDPSISADGRYVAFSSWDWNLVAGDTNSGSDVFLHDRVTGVTTRASVSSTGTEADGQSWYASISSDGRYVAFYSEASNLVAGDTNGVMDVFVKDRVTGATTRVSTDSSGGEGDEDSDAPSISSDGRYVAFCSLASTFAGEGTYGAADVFVKDRVTGAITRVSVSSTGAQGDYVAAGSFDPSISSDGRYVAFSSDASNFAAGDTNGVADVFLHDRVTGATTRVSVDTAGGQGNGQSYYPSVSSDGRYVAFESEASNLVAGDTNGVADVFLHDRVTGATTRVSVDTAGGQGNGGTGGNSMSADGRLVAFSSVASNLVAGDTNGVSDIFVHENAIAVSETTPPVTTSDAIASYVGTAAIHLSAVDNPGGSGVAHTYYRLDGGTQTEGLLVGTAVVGAHTLEFWSVDVAGNIETHKTVGFTITPAGGAPAPTSITIRTAATTTSIGKTVPLSGAVTPMGMIGVNIVVYVMKPGKTYWTYSSNRTVYSLGGSPAWLYKYYFKPGMARGSYKFKARAPAPGFASSDAFSTSESPTTVTISVR